MDAQFENETLAENGGPPQGGDVFDVRLKKLATLRADGQDPYRQNWEQTHTAARARAMLGDANDCQEVVSLAGRILAFRAMGRATFFSIQDRSGTIQCYVRREAIGEAAYDRFLSYDRGDIVGVAGPLFRTKTGEPTVRVSRIQLVSKSLRPLPEKFHGLTNGEQIYRERHLDLIVNGQSRRRAMQRIAILREIRNFLWGREFVEVETPFLQSVAGGAAAKPFTTHMNALGQDFYLRISLELYLKRLLVAGFDRVFELGRVFRNEGLSRRHNPEFTMLELYQAYTDHRGMMSLVKDLLLHLCDRVIGSRDIVQADGMVIHLDGAWQTADYRDLVREATGISQWFALQRTEKLEHCARLGIAVDPNQEDFAIDNDVYAKLVEPTLIQPTFVLHLPRELCPLAKLSQEDPGTLDVFELCINGQEIAPAYSEQNDPLLQRQLFEMQVGEDRQALDTEFLTALEYGMPPAGGMGIGIDRLVVLLTGASNIRDSILYPILRRIV
ncbi:MAG: lysine--tRNA ligase [Puniceicoccales bacterium]|jgi:lysyl-tRNA synthetase class 2|nr:lysine--tRNA ligase [Puniceicoccales bacterium]